MVNRFSNAIYWLVIGTVLVVVGCEQKYKEGTVVLNPLVDPNFVVPDYVSRTIEAAGGRRAWIETEKLEFDCVVTFYDADGIPYLTEQHHEICPWRPSVRVSALEPQGELVWSLSGNEFRVVKGRELTESFPTSLCERDFAEALLHITTAPARLLDRRFEFAEGDRLVRIEGLWYYPIEGQGPDGIAAGRYWAKVVFYRNRDSSLVDMIRFLSPRGRVDEKCGALTVRGYNYREIEKGGVLVPAKIEIFGTDARGTLTGRLVKVDYYSSN